MYVPIHEKQHLLPMTVTAVAPMAAENLPAKQSEPPFVYVPIHEKQHLLPMTVTAVAPMAAENLPAKQLMQVLAPALD